MTALSYGDRKGGEQNRTIVRIFGFYLVKSHYITCRQQPDGVNTVLQQSIPLNHYIGIAFAGVFTLDV